MTAREGSVVTTELIEKWAVEKVYLCPSGSNRPLALMQFIAGKRLIERPPKTLSHANSPRERMPFAREMNLSPAKAVLHVAGPPTGKVSVGQERAFTTSD